MKIGLYLQDYRQNFEKVFYDALEAVKSAELDLLVFPELCYTPFESDFYKNNILDENDKKRACNRALKISELAGCAVMIGGEDRRGMIYSVFANAHSKGNETKTAIYLKHTMAGSSPLIFPDYNKKVNDYFKGISLKGKRLGMIICYDCNHAAFSRAYAKEGVDYIINLTGGNVVQTKWHRYNKVRAIENNCFNFCTMGYNDNGKENSYTFGFTPKGKLMTGVPLLKGLAIGNITVYDTDKASNEFGYDINIAQQATFNEKGNYIFDASNIKAILSRAENIAEGLYVLPNGKENLVICTIPGEDMLKPEKVLTLLYHEKLKKIFNKRYLIVNQWHGLDNSFYRTILSDILKVRSMENFCAVILLSDNYTKCYQCGKNRTSQVVAGENGKYDLDLDRMGGPEVIWRNKQGMKAIWRKEYESLIKYIDGIE